METVEVVIKMPKEDYMFIKTMVENGYETPSSCYYNIASGIVLPKGHGKLKDIDEVIKWLEIYDERYNERFAKTPIKDIPMYDLGKRNRNDDVISIMDRFPTIIGADKEVESNGV